MIASLLHFVTGCAGGRRVERTAWCEKALKKTLFHCAHRCLIERFVTSRFYRFLNMMIYSLCIVLFQGCSTRQQLRISYFRQHLGLISHPISASSFLGCEGIQNANILIQNLVLQKSAMWLSFFLESCQDTYFCRQSWWKKSQQDVVLLTCAVPSTNRSVR